MPEVLLNPYCSVEDVQKELQNNDSTLIEELIRAINAASRAIDLYLGRDFFFHDYTVTPMILTKWSQGICGDEIFLPWRILTITKVKVSTEIWASGVDYFAPESPIEGKVSLISLRGSWPIGAPPTGTIEVTGTFGYFQAATVDVPLDIPADIRQAAILIAAAYSGHNQREVIGLDGTKEQIIDKKIPKTATDILNKRRRILI